MLNPVEYEQDMQVIGIKEDHGWVACHATLVTATLINELPLPPPPKYWRHAIICYYTDARYRLHDDNTALYCVKKMRVIYIVSSCCIFLRAPPFPALQCPGWVKGVPQLKSWVKNTFYQTSWLYLSCIVQLKAIVVDDQMPCLAVEQINCVPCALAEQQTYTFPPLLFIDMPKLHHPCYWNNNRKQDC